MSDYNALEQRAECTLPMRIKAGSIQDNYMHVETSKGFEDIYFEYVDYICLGVIEEKSSMTCGPKTITMPGTGCSDPRSGYYRPQEKVTLFAENHNHMMHILDIYLKDSCMPYRIDASAVGYKGFVTKMAYTSLDNFRNLLRNVCIKATGSKFSASLISFMFNLRDNPSDFASPDDFYRFKLKHPDFFASLDDFFAASQKDRLELENNYSWDDLDFDSLPVIGDLDGKW